MNRRLALTLILLTIPMLYGAPPAVEIHLQEAIGRSWPESIVHRSITAAPGQLPATELVLHEADARYATQLSDVTRHDDGSLKSATVWFRTDLQADADRRLILQPLADGETMPTTDLAVDESTAGILEIRNAHTAVRLPAPSSDLPLTAGPLLGVRLASGAWTATSSWAPATDADITRSVEIVEQGPLLVHVRIVYTLSDGGSYTCDVTLRAGESVVRLDEKYDQAGRLAIALGGDAAPDQVASEASSRGAVKVEALTYEGEQKLVSFVGWDLYLGDRAHAIELRNSASGDLLGIVSTDSDWLPNPNDQIMHLKASQGRRLELTGSLEDGHRHWGLVVGTTAQYQDPGLDMQRWWCRRVVLPLEKVATWKLIWPGMLDIDFPHTFFAADELPALRRKLQSHQTIQDYMETLIGKPSGSNWRTARTIAANTSDERLATFERFSEAYEARGGITAGVSYIAAAHLYTGKPVFVDQLTDSAGVSEPASQYLDKLIDVYLQGEGPLTKGGRMAHMSVSDAFMLRYLAWEFMLASDKLDEKQKRRMLSKLAFSTYLMHESEWQPAIHMPDGTRPVGYPQGTANMKTCALACRAITACMLSNHPALQGWIDFALAEIGPHMKWTVHPSGAMQESPFYTSRDTIRYVPFWTAMIRAGVSPETPAFERAGQAFSYLVDMLTPPDPRMGDRRVYHAFGRSSPGVIDPTFIIGAHPWGVDNPRHGQRMRWAWEEQGRPSPDTMQTTGGRNIGLTLIGMSHMLDYEPPAEPLLRSRRYKGFGVIMRGGVGTEFESNVMFRHDPFAWDLYPPNNGAVYLYAKGVPLLPRLGGYWMAQKKQITGMSAPFGNRVIYGSGDQRALGRTTAFALLGDVADYAAGISGDKRWERFVLYSKDLDHQDDLYLLVRDEVRKNAEGSAVHWWIATEDVQPDGFEKPGVVPVKYPGGDQQWLAQMGKNWARHAAATLPPPESIDASNAMQEGGNELDMLSLEPEKKKKAPPEHGPPNLKGPHMEFTGQFGVDLDMVILTPSTTNIVTDAVGIGPGMPYCINPNLYEFQQLVRVEPTVEAPTASFLTLLAPRLPDGATRTFQEIAGGRGVQITTPQEKSWLFLSDDIFEFQADAVSFSGQSGICRIGESRLRLTVHSGQIEADGVTLKTAGYAALLIDDGQAILWSDDPAAVSIDLSGRWENRELQRVTVNAD